MTIRGPKKFLEDLAQTSEGALTILKAFLQMATFQGMGDFVAKERWYIRLSTIEDFVPWETLEAITKDVSIESLSSQEERQAVGAFRRAVARRRRGKPDFGVGLNIGDED